MAGLCVLGFGVGEKWVSMRSYWFHGFSLVMTCPLCWRETGVKRANWTWWGSSRIKRIELVYYTNGMMPMTREGNGQVDVFLLE